MLEACVEKLVDHLKDYSEKDYLAVKQLLGRAPVGFLKVEKYHPKHAHPMVIQVFPWVKKRPFPTLFWLTCPILKKEISHIEKDAWISRFEAEIFNSGSQELEQLRADHLSYQKERTELFEKSHHNWDELPSAQKEIITESGIGGMANFDHIKCFHLHYAHHLARQNCVGAALDAKFGLNKFY